MTAEKILEVVSLYEERLSVFTSFSGKVSHSLRNPHKFQVIHHCRAMLPEIKEFVKEQRIEKAFRHLGFLQGCLWNQGIYTIEELKNHNRP